MDKPPKTEFKIDCVYGPNCLIKISNPDHAEKYPHRKPCIYPLCLEKVCLKYRKAYAYATDRLTIFDAELYPILRHCAHHDHPAMDPDDAALALIIAGGGESKSRRGSLNSSRILRPDGDLSTSARSSAPGSATSSGSNSPTSDSFIKKIIRRVSSDSSADQETGSTNSSPAVSPHVSPSTTPTLPLNTIIRGLPTSSPASESSRSRDSERSDRSVKFGNLSGSASPEPSTSPLPSVRESPKGNLVQKVLTRGQSESMIAEMDRLKKGQQKLQEQLSAMQQDMTVVLGWIKSQQLATPTAPKEQ
jgi:hypothetical protein